MLICSSLSHLLITCRREESIHGTLDHKHFVRYLSTISISSRIKELSGIRCLYVMLCIVTSPEKSNVSDNKGFLVYILCPEITVETGVSTRKFHKIYFEDKMR